MSEQLREENAALRQKNAQLSEVSVAKSRALLEALDGAEKMREAAARFLDEKAEQWEQYNRNSANMLQDYAADIRALPLPGEQIWQAIGPPNSAVPVGTLVMDKDGIHRWNGQEWELVEPAADAPVIVNPSPPE